MRRCLDATCCPPGSKIWAWLPDPVVDQSGKHHKPFESVLGTDTTEKDRPSSLGQTVSAVAQDLQVDTVQFK